MFDRVVVNDTGVNGTGELTDYAGWLGKHLQTGKLPNYALAMVVGVVVLAIVGVRITGLDGELMDSGHWVLATDRDTAARGGRDPVRARTTGRTSCAGSASPSARVLFAISLYIFFAYEIDSGEGYQFFIRCDWLENVGFLGEHGISLALRHRWHRRADGPAQRHRLPSAAR